MTRRIGHSPVRLCRINPSISEGDPQPIHEGLETLRESGEAFPTPLGKEGGHQVFWWRRRRTRDVFQRGETVDDCKREMTWRESVTVETINVSNGYGAERIRARLVRKGWYR